MSLPAPTPPPRLSDRSGPSPPRHPVPRGFGPSHSSASLLALALLLAYPGGCVSEPEPEAPASPIPGDGNATEDASAPDPTPEPTTDPAGDPGIIKAGCRPGEPRPEAFVPSGSTDGRTAIIPGGRAVTPVGTLVPVGRAALGLALSPDGSRIYVTGDGDRNQSLLAVDFDDGEVVQTLSGFEAFRGVAATPDGQMLVVGEGRDGMLRTFVPSDEDVGIFKPGPTLDLGGYLGDLALSPDGQMAYVASNTASAIYAVRLASMTVERIYGTGNYPYDLVVDPLGERLYVSNLAGSTVQVIDLTHAASDDAPDSEGDDILAVIDTPQGPEGMVLDPAGARLYVPCADDDVVLIIDTETLLPLGETDLSHHPEGLLASSPNDVALSPDGQTLYVVQADLNQIDLVDAWSGALLGSLPAGWYPVAVEAHPDGERIAVVNTKGLGSRPDMLDPTGLLQIITLPDAAGLAEHTEQAWQNNTRPGRFYAEGCDEILPAEDGEVPIKHVVLIVRENKTYDAVLGDLEGANGDPELTLFGEEITPNLHALARAFVNMDNYHSDPEESLQGHLWTTQADCGDFVEKLRNTQTPLSGFEAASLSSSNNIFEHCLEHGISFRNYGEIVTFGPELLGRMRDFIDPKFPFFNMGVPDEEKAREVIREWDLGIFPQFIYIGLPNDHTMGTRPGAPTPESMVADNDYATGMLVDWISKSPYWSKTIIFIIEDDPQSYRGDHVDAHRSISVVVSPWVKRGYVSHVHYSIPSMYRTIEMILGLPPMNKNDAGAAPMYDIFRDTADGPALTSFDLRPLGVLPDVNGIDAPMAAESMALDWESVDGVPGLGLILWRARKGDVDPPPYAVGIDR